MANIAMLLDSEEGHLFPTFRLAKDLEKRGHQVWYLGYRSAEQFVCQQGLKFMPALGDASPAQQIEPRLPLRPLLSGRALDGAVESIACDVFLTLSMFCLEALILRYRYKTPVILLRSNFSLMSRARLCRDIVIGRLMESTDGAYELVEMLLSAGLSIKNFSDIAALVVDEMPEIVLFPEVFGSKEMSSDKKLCYAGFAVDAKRFDDSFDWGGIEDNRKLIYCSLGSQAHLRLEASRLFLGS
jgi:UDP:flavonoid glycosyltransferase YjiC (YdhE family)